MILWWLLLQSEKNSRIKVDIPLNLSLYALSADDSSGIRKKNPSKIKLQGFICNNEGHRQTQFKANELCGECSSIFSCTPFPFFFVRLRVLSMHLVMNSGGISMWKTATDVPTHFLRLKSKSYRRDSQWNKNIRTLISPALSEGLWICWVWNWNAQFAPINCWCIIHAVTQTILEITYLINRRPRALISFQLC